MTDLSRFQLDHREEDILRFMCRYCMVNPATLDEDGVGEMLGGFDASDKLQLAYKAGA